MVVIVIICSEHSIKNIHCIQITMATTVSTLSIQTLTCVNNHYINHKLQYTNLNIQYTNLNIEYTKLNIQYTNLNIEYTKLTIEYTKLNFQYAKPCMCLHTTMVFQTLDTFRSQCVYVRMYACMHVCMYVCMYVHTYVCM